VLCRRSIKADGTLHTERQNLQKPEFATGTALAAK
jgi:hypothetical protein